MEAKRQKRGASPVGQEAEVADADEAFGEQVQQEATQKLVQRQRHQSLLIIMSRVAPAKGDLAIGERDQAVVGDGDAMGVAAQILEHVLGASEGGLAVDHPVLSVEWPQPGSEDLGLSQGGQLAREAELAVLKGRLEAGHELATKPRRNTQMGRKKRGRDRIQWV